MIFQIAGTEVKIIGSIHLLPSGEPPLATVYRAVIDSSSEIFFETDLAQSPPLAEMGFTKEPNLSALLLPTAYTEAKARWTELEIPFPFEKAKPWTVALLIGVFAQVRAGFDPHTGVDRQLWTYAEEKERDRSILEENSLRAFDDAPTNEGVAWVDFVLATYEQGPQRLERLIEAWRGGDFEVIAATLDEMRAICPAGNSALFAKRNLAWMAHFMRVIEAGKSAVFVVGCGHLKYGEHSLEKLLLGRGYALHQLLV